MDWNQSVLDTLVCSALQRAKAHHVVKMLWVWLQLLAFAIPFILPLFFPISFALCPCSPSVSSFFTFILKLFTGIRLVFRCQGLLSHIASLTLCVCMYVCVLNHNPVNPTSNGVYWERYQTWPLGLVLWPSYTHEKQGFNAICPTDFQSMVENLFFLIRHKWTVLISK